MDNPPQLSNSSRPVQIQRWIKVLGSDSPELEAELNSRISAKVATLEFSRKDIDYVASLERPLLPGTLSVSVERLEKLRKLCQLWDIDIHCNQIESHRKVLGPLIVGAKKLFLPVLRGLLKDMIRQQRDFNAAAIRLLAELSNELEGRSTQRGSRGANEDKIHFNS